MGRPVKDIKLKIPMTVNQLILEMQDSGGFTAKKLSDAVDIIERMFRDSECTVFLSFPACIMATGTRGIMVELAKRKLIDVIITTCGTIDHDLARCWKSYYHGDFFMDDAELRRRGISRLGNVLVPDESYGLILEEKLTPLFEEILGNKNSISTREIIDAVGEHLDNQDSLIYWCHKNRIPIFVPGITDGAFGTQLWMYWQTHRKFSIDLFKDEQDLSDIVFEAKKAGAIIVGGGISKHHTIWWNQFRGGLDYVVYLTTAQEYDGSLSGARVREAVSWGKVKETADEVTVEGDATISFPIIVASVLERLEGLN
ncbi:MAG: deoxyhypusine synthase [Methanomassiliicoccales archaeon]|nr:deoxyhypusine synthase [Methanomassiliicoccales archaeon]